MLYIMSTELMFCEWQNQTKDNKQANSHCDYIILA